MKDYEDYKQEMKGLREKQEVNRKERKENLMRKSELNEYSLQDFGDKFNVTSVCFCPFKEWISFDDEDDEYEALEALKYSTVFGGNRFYFDTPNDLKNFCEIVENLEKD